MNKEFRKKLESLKKRQHLFVGESDNPEYMRGRNGAIKGFIVDIDHIINKLK